VLTLEMKTGKNYVSHSSLSTWLQCGWSFYLSRIQRVEEAPSWWLVGGKAVHEATEYYDLNGSEGFNSASVFMEAWTRNLPDNLSALKFRSAGKKNKTTPFGEDSSWWLNEGPKMVDRWVEFRLNSGYQVYRYSDGTAAIETKMDQVVGGVPVKAVLDRLMVTPSGELIVVDIKTGSREPMSKMQMGIYAVLVEKQFGLRPTGGAYWMSRSGELTEQYDLSHFTESRLASWAKNFEKAVLHDLYIPSPGMMCGTCGVRDACYIVKGKDSYKYPEITEDGESNV